MGRILFNFIKSNEIQVGIVLSSFINLWAKFNSSSIKIFSLHITSLKDFLQEIEQNKLETVWEIYLRLKLFANFMEKIPAETLGLIWKTE